MTDKELKQHIFELSFALDGQSARKDYASLRNTHYNNQKWLHDNGLQEEYYLYFITKIWGEKMTVNVLIKNMPEKVHRFVVVRCVKDVQGKMELWFFGSYDDEGRARNAEAEIDNGMMLEVK